jgi:hypothetical protein
LPGGAVGAGDSSTGRVVAVIEAAVSGQVAGGGVSVVDGLCAALAEQAVAGRVGAVAVQGGAVLYFFAAVAAQIVTVVGAAGCRFTALAKRGQVTFYQRAKRGAGYFLPAK